MFGLSAHLSSMCVCCAVRSIASEPYLFFSFSMYRNDIGGSAKHIIDMREHKKGNLCAAFIIIFIFFLLSRCRCRFYFVALMHQRLWHGAYLWRWLRFYAYPAYPAPRPLLYWCEIYWELLRLAAVLRSLFSRFSIRCGEMVQCVHVMYWKRVRPVCARAFAVHARNSAAICRCVFIRDCRYQLEAIVV